MMELSWQIDGEIVIHEVKSNLDSYPIGSWIFNGDIDDPKACISYKSKENTVNVSEIGDFATWDNLDSEGNVSLAKDKSELCVESLSGDDMSWLSNTIFTVDNATFKAPYHSETIISIPEGGIVLDSRNLMFSQSILALNHEGNCLELGTHLLRCLFPMILEFGICQSYRWPRTTQKM